MKRDVKQVIVLRKDLNMRKGKMVAQGAHASMKVIVDMLADHDDGSLVIQDEQISDAMRQWLNGAFAKVCVGVNSESELGAIYQKARDAGLPCSIITDAGRTEFNGVPTKTAVAIGPAYVDEIDSITGDLSLL